MRSFDQRDVVSPLKCVPEHVPAVASSAWALSVHSAGEIGKSRHRLYRTYKLSWDEAECGVGHQRINNLGHSTLNGHSAVKAEPNYIQEFRTHDVLLTERDELA